MSWQYLKNRDEILRKEVEEEEKVNYFIQEGFYKNVVRVALDEAVKEKLFISYKEEVNNEHYKKIILEFPCAYEYLSENHILEIEKNEDFIKLRLTHAETQMDVSNQEYTKYSKRILQ